MSDLTPAARALLDAARSGMQPTRDAIARMRHGVGAASATAGASVGLVAKLTVVGLLVTGAAAGRTPVPHPQPVSVPVLAPATAGEPARDDVPDVQLAASEPAPPPPPLVAARPRATAIGLAREVELVDRASAALRRQDPTTALAELETYRRESRGAGQLAHEAAELAIAARCQLVEPDPIACR